MTATATLERSSPGEDTAGTSSSGTGTAGTVAGRTPATPSGRVSARSIQIGLGLLWLLDGLLQLQPKMFGADFANGVILPMTQGQPNFVSAAMTLSLIHI